MRKFACLFAIAAIGGLTSFASVGSASPLAAGVAGAGAVVPTVSDDLVQKVHGWHCRRRYGWYRGHKYRHRHRRACYNRYHYDDDYYPYAGVPFFSFHFGDDDDRRGRRRYHRRNRDRDDDD